MADPENSRARAPINKKSLLGFALLNGVIALIFLELTEVSLVQEHLYIHKGTWLLTNLLVNFLGVKFLPR